MATIQVLGAPRRRRHWRGQAIVLVLALLAALVPSVLAARPAAAASSPTVAIAGTPGGDGYWIALADGRVLRFGDAAPLGSPTTPARPVVDLEVLRDGTGYWLVTDAGVVAAFGTARHLGDLAGTPLGAPIVGMAARTDGSGYWLLGGDGGVFSFGTAAFHGSTGGMRLNQPVVGMAATPSGAGYWLVAADGGIFAFGDAPFHGSTGATPLTRPVVGMAATPSGAGYWLVAADGGIFAFGDAPFLGSTGDLVLAQPVVGIDVPPGTSSYRMVATDGGVFSFGLPFHGSATTEPLRVHLTPVAELDEPTAMAVRPGDGSLWFAEQDGRVRALRNGALATPLDLRPAVLDSGEQGLLGLAFSPDGNHLYVHYSSRAGGGDTTVVEYAMGAVDPVAGSARSVLGVDQPFSNHNGGQLAFGADGFLYVALGDGGGAGDPQGRAQDLDTLLGKVLRIDPRGAGADPYLIPPGNPFVGVPGARPEIWSYGLRNPWRFSFDAATGDLWIADVGQERVEEIDLARGGVGGRNYGWDRLEGSAPFEGAPPAGHDLPVLELRHADGYCSVIGGSVYRGAAIPALEGAYVFSDFCRGRLEAIRVPFGATVTERIDLGVPAVHRISSFGVDGAGELHVLSLDGPVHRIDPG